MPGGPSGRRRSRTRSSSRSRRRMSRTRSPRRRRSGSRTRKRRSRSRRRSRSASRRKRSSIGTGTGTPAEEVGAEKRSRKRSKSPGEKRRSRSPRRSRLPCKRKSKSRSESPPPPKLVTEGSETPSSRRRLRSASRRKRSRRRRSRTRSSSRSRRRMSRTRSPRRRRSGSRTRKRKSRSRRRSRSASRRKRSRMAAQAGRFTDDRYINWVKDTLALIYLKEGLEVFVDTQSAVFHSHLITTLGNRACGTCSCRDLVKRKGQWTINCPVCQPWLTHIISKHKYRPQPVLATKNSDPQLWTTNAWEVMKLYQAKGCQDQHSARDADVAGILAVIGNCDHFHSFLSNLDLVDEITAIRNRCMHSSDLHVETVDLGTDLQTMLQFLRGLSVAEQGATDNAIEKIQELQTGLLELSLYKELELQALQQKQNVLATNLKCVEHEQAATSEKLQAEQDSFKRFLQANNLEQDMARLSTVLEHHDQRIKKVETQAELQAVQDIFNRCLQATNLVQDMARLSTGLEHNDQRIKNVETQAQHLDVTTKQLEGEMATLYQRQQAHESQIQTHTPMLESQHDKIENIEARLHNQQTGSETSEMTDEAIAALRASLIKHYIDNSLHVKIPVVGQELAIEDIYVVPDIKVLREADKPRGVLSTVHNPESTRNTSICKEIFYTTAYKNKQIYTTADAGMGKTTFCKYLVNLWCEAHNESRSDSPTKSNSNDKNPQRQKTQAKAHDIKIMSSFKLLFYITLRDSAKLYMLDDMIDAQILQSSRKTRSLKASDVLQTEGCLVIIDGLDEWACPEGVEVPNYVNPGIPGKLDFNSNTVFLTTTRPWKYDVLNLSNQDVDKLAELVGFDSKSADDLCFKLFKVMNKAESVKKDVQAFKADIQKGLSHLFNIPVILTVLVCLWFDKQSLGISRVQLFCSMLDMLLKRAAKNFPKQTYASKSETTCEEMQLPECFQNHDHCQTYQMYLVKLCKVAFEALFNQKREHALVFESSQMGLLGVDHINVDLFLKSGILSQTKVLGKWSGSEKKLSFLHKSLQEFLAAVFITWANEESIISPVKQFCTSVESMLEMSQVWMFLSGINCDVAKQLLTDLITSVLKDSRLKQYRHTFESPALALPIQTCILECVIEATCNGNNDLCLPLEDFVINKWITSTCLERLLTFNTAAIKSFYISTSDMEPDTVERVMCQLQDTQCLQKLHLYDRSYASTNMQPLCKTLDNNKDSLTCLQLESIKMTTKLSDAVCSVLTHVTALDLYYVILTHKQIEQLFLSVSQAQHIRQLRLLLFCTDHGDQCRAEIDLSGFTQLRTLVLWHMYIARLPVLTDCLESVELWFCTISESQLKQFIHALSSTCHTLKVELSYVTITEVSDKPLYLTYLKHNPELVVTQCQYNDNNSYYPDTWAIKFHIKQQPTTASDNQK